jgi:O-antigen/teichoic acid export membrane protein
MSPSSSTRAEPRPTIALAAAPPPQSVAARLFAMRHRAGELAWVMAGKFGMMGANAALMLLLAERFDLPTYGQFVTMISGQLLLSRAIMPGIESGVTRLRALDEYERREDELIRAGLRIIFRLCALASLFAVGICLAWELLHEPHWMVWLTAAIVVGAAGTALVDYSYSVHLARLKYREAASAQGGTALLRLVAIAPVALFWPQYAPLVFLLYPLVTLLSGLLQTRLLRLKRVGLIDPRALRELLQYSGWQAVTNVAAVLSLYQGTFVLNLYGQQTATGLFGLGLTLSQGFFAINNAYTEYLLPRAVTALNLDELRWFLRRAFVGAFLLALAGVPVTLALGRMTKLLKPELHAVKPIFYCLAAAMLLLIFQAPLSAAFHYLLRPHLLTLGWGLLVVCTGTLSLILARTQGAWGAAVGQLTGTTLAMLLLAVMLAFAWRAARREVGRTASPPPLRD